MPSQFIDFNILLIFESANHSRSYCLLPPVFIVVPWLGGQSSGGSVVDLGLHALTALLIMMMMMMIGGDDKNDGNVENNMLDHHLHPDPCVPTLAGHVAGSQVELSRESLPVDVL